MAVKKIKIKTEVYYEQVQTVDDFQNWALEAETMFEGVQSIYSVLWDMMEQGLGRV